MGRLGREEKLAALWVMTNRDTNNIGYLKVSARVFAFDTGCELSALQGALKGLPRAFAYAEEEGGLAVLVVNYVRWQFGESASDPKNRLYKHLQGLARGLRGYLREVFEEHYPALAGVSTLEGGSRGIEGTRTEQNSTAQNSTEGVLGETSKHQHPTSNEAEGLLKFLNERTGSAFLATPETLAAIGACLARVGGDAAGIRQMIERQAGLWGAEARMKNYLRPATLFGEKFGEYYGQRALALAPSGGASTGRARAAVLREKIEKSRANRASVYHSSAATAAEKAQLAALKRELQEVEG